jgi:hypothetical protein
MQMLRPETRLATLVSKRLAGKADRQETWYKTPYRVRKTAFLRRLCVVEAHGLISFPSLAVRLVDDVGDGHSVHRLASICNHFTLWKVSMNDSD